jgi:hypothetical protein
MFHQSFGFFLDSLSQLDYIISTPTWFILRLELANDSGWRVSRMVNRAIFNNTFKKFLATTCDHCIIIIIIIIMSLINSH